MWKRDLKSQLNGYNLTYSPAQLANFREVTQLFMLCKHIGKVNAVVWTAGEAKQTLQLCII